MKTHVAKALDEELALRGLAASTGRTLKLPEEVAQEVEWALLRHKLDLVKYDHGQAELCSKDGDCVDLQYLDTGARSTVYKDGRSNVYAFLKQGDLDKTVAATVHRLMPDNPHVPAVNPLGHIDVGDIYGWLYAYIMPEYNVPVPEIQRRAQADYAKIRVCDIHKDRVGVAMHRAVNCLRDERATPALIDAFEALSLETTRQQPGATYDIKRSNFGVDGDGNLVVLDLSILST